MKRKRLLLILLAILLIIGLGYAGWQQWGNKTPDTQQNTQTTDPSEGGKYLVIKEWGVRFLLSDELIGDISYSHLINPNHEVITLNSVKADLQNCAPTSIIRTQTQNPNSIHVDNSYFDLHIGPAACDLKDSPRQVKAYEVQQKLSNAVKELEKI